MNRTAEGVVQNLLDLCEAHGFVSFYIKMKILPLKMKILPLKTDDLGQVPNGGRRHLLWPIYTTHKIRQNYFGVFTPRTQW